MKTRSTSYTADGCVVRATEEPALIQEKIVPDNPITKSTFLDMGEGIEKILKQLDEDFQGEIVTEGENGSSYVYTPEEYNNKGNFSTQEGIITYSIPKKRGIERVDVIYNPQQPDKYEIKGNYLSEQSCRKIEDFLK